MSDSTSAGPVPQPSLDEPAYGATFAEAFVRFWSKYAVFTGRASRSEFWRIVLMFSIADVLLDMHSGPSITIGRFALGLPTPFSWGVERDIIFWLIVAAAAIPAVALTTRRLHDRDMSGWWQLIVLVPLVGPILLIIWTAGHPRPEGARFDALPGRR